MSDRKRDRSRDRRDDWRSDKRDRRGEDDRRGRDRRGDEDRRPRRGDDDDRRRDRRRDERRSVRSESPPRKGRFQANVGGAVRNLRIDRHECRKAAIEFLIHNYDSTAASKESLEPMVNSHIRSLDLDADYYTFTVEILFGLLVDRKYTVIADRWIMGILDEHLQAELRVPDLSILRVAGFELLTHPEIPTTVVINEVNVLAKMYCPEKQSLIHAAVNRMIETQLSIGNEIAMENGVANERKSNPLSALIGLDQEAQLAMILLDQEKHSKRTTRSASPEKAAPAEPPTRSTKESLHKPVVRQSGGQFKIHFLPPKPVIRETEPPPTKQEEGTQTVKDPTIEPGVRIFKVQV